MAARPNIPREILESAKANGWEITPTKNGRLRWTHPNAPAPVYSSKHGGGGRGWENHRAELQRAMLGKGPERRSGGLR